MLRHFKNFLFKSEEERFLESFVKTKELTEKDSKIFFDNLKNPKEPSPAFKKAKGEYDGFVKDCIIDSLEQQIKILKQKLSISNKHVEYQREIIDYQKELIKELKKQI